MQIIVQVSRVVWLIALLWLRLAVALLVDFFQWTGVELVQLLLELVLRLEAIWKEAFDSLSEGGVFGSWCLYWWCMLVEVSSMQLRCSIGIWWCMFHVWAAFTTSTSLSLFVGTFRTWDGAVAKSAWKLLLLVWWMLIPSALIVHIVVCCSNFVLHEAILLVLILLIMELILFWFRLWLLVWDTCVLGFVVGAHRLSVVWCVTVIHHVVAAVILLGVVDALRWWAVAVEELWSTWFLESAEMLLWARILFCHGVDHLVSISLFLKTLSLVLLTFQNCLLQAESFFICRFQQFELSICLLAQLLLYVELPRLRFILFLKTSFIFHFSLINLFLRRPQSTFQVNDFILSLLIRIQTFAFVSPQSVILLFQIPQIFSQAFLILRCLMSFSLDVIQGFIKLNHFSFLFFSLRLCLLPQDTFFFQELDQRINFGSQWFTTFFIVSYLLFFCEELNLEVVELLLSLLVGCWWMRWLGIEMDLVLFWSWSFSGWTFSVEGRFGVWSCWWKNHWSVALICWLVNQIPRIWADWWWSSLIIQDVLIIIRGWFIAELVSMWLWSWSKLKFVQLLLKGLNLSDEFTVSSVPIFDDHTLLVKLCLQLFNPFVKKLLLQLLLLFIMLTGRMLGSLLVVECRQMLARWWTFNSSSCMWLIFSLDSWVNDLLWQSNDETTFSNVATFYPLVSKFMLHTECFPCIIISQTKLTFCIDANHTWLLILQVNHHCHRWTHCNTLNFKWIDSFSNFDAQTLLDALVMQDSPQVNSVLHVNSCIEVPARNGFEGYFFVFLELFEAITDFEVCYFCEVEYFEVTLVWVDSQLILVVLACCH